MPLQPSSYRLLLPLLKSVHVLRQKKVVRQTLGNTTPFTFLPHPYTSTRGEWLAVQLKLRLPCLCCLGRGCHAHPDLSLWLLYDNAPKWLRGNLGYNISQTGRSMLGNTLPLSGSSGLGKRWGGGEVFDLGPEVVATVWSALHRAQSDQWSWSSRSPCLYYDQIQYQKG